MRSIIVKDLKTCMVCKTTEGVETHHCIHGTAGRKLATRYHLLVGLCSECHRGIYGVHGKEGAKLDLAFKQMAQIKWEEKYGDTQKFIQVFGKSYLAQEYVDFEEIRQETLKKRYGNEIPQQEDYC